MSINFPSSLDTLSNPTGTDSTDSATAALKHATQHANANDAIEALEAKVGIDSSAVTTTHDYKLSGVTGTDKAASKTGTETLTNKTLTSPIINVTSDATGDIYYRNSGGAFTRLAIGSAGQVLQVSAGLPSWAANAAAADASVTQKGVAEEATQAECDARTATGTEARLFVNPSTLRGIHYHDYAADSVGTDSYAITVTPAPTALSTGDVFVFKAGTANTGAATLNVNSLGAKTIKKKNDQDLVTGDIELNQIVTVVYDGTNMQMQSQVASEPIVFASGTTTKNAADASTTQTIAHGLVKTPKWVRITCSSIYASASVTWLTAVAVYNGTTQSSQSVWISGGTATTCDNSFTLTNTNAGTTTGVVTVDSTNINIAWTKTSSPAGTYQILWEAYA